jgi:uncharacterized protein with PIN domain
MLNEADTDVTDDRDAVHRQVTTVFESAGLFINDDVDTQLSELIETIFLDPRNDPGAWTCERCETPIAEHRRLCVDCAGDPEE